MNFLDRNEFNFEPSEEVKNAIKNFDLKKLCFYTRIYDEGKKSIFSVYLSELYDIDERQVVLGYGAEDLLKKAVHFFLTEGGSKTMLIPKFSWWYYKSIASEVSGTTLQYPVYEDGDTFSYDFDGLKAMIDDVRPKILLVASPNNPTGNNLDRKQIEKVLSNFNGIVVIDEAYSDFSSERPFRLDLEEWPNIIVLNTMSKAWGCAAIRLGMAYASKDIIALFNKVKYPYNINLLTQQKAKEALRAKIDVEKWVTVLLQERGRMMAAFTELPICEKVYPSDSNFFLAKMTDAQGIYDYLVEKGIIVRNRTRVALCNNCLRITIGSKTENQELLAALRRLI